MAGFGCAHRSEYVRNIRRVLVSRFNRADAFRNKVVPPMMVKFACEFVTVLGTGEQFQRSFSSCFRYERLGKSRFVRVHACTVTPQTDAATLSIVVTRAITLIEICADPGNHWFSPSRTRARTGRHFVPHLSVVGTTSIPLSEILFHAIPL